MESKRKIILFGGSFDPIHNGHLGVARHALRALGGEQLIIVPAGQSPHKKEPHTAGRHRLAMIQCAIEPLEHIFVSDCELRRAGPSYTLETIRYFKQQLAVDSDFYWLIGADQLDDLPRWYHINELLQECHIATMVRAGYPRPEMSRFQNVFSAAANVRLWQDIVETPRIEISATDIREQLSQGRIPESDLPNCVIDYIRKHSLYGIK